MPRDRTTRKLYSCPDDRRQNDPTDDGPAIAGPMPPKRGKMGRPRRTGLRSVLDGGRHILSTGRRWRALPIDIHRIPPTGTVSTSGAGAVRRACPDSPRDPARQCAGRSTEPTAATIDGRSVRTTGSGGPRGHDAGGKVRGRKRSVAVDAGGTPVTVMVHAAGIQDRDGAPDVTAKPSVTTNQELSPLFPRIFTSTASSDSRSSALEFGCRQDPTHNIDRCFHTRPRSATGGSPNPPER